MTKASTKTEEGARIVLAQDLADLNLGTAFTRTAGSSLYTQSQDNGPSPLVRVAAPEELERLRKVSVKEALRQSREGRFRPNDAETETRIILPGSTPLKRKMG